jgi:hypothetical protein
MLEKGKGSSRGGGGERGGNIKEKYKLINIK